MILALVGLSLSIAVVLQKRFDVAIGYIAMVLSALAFINEIAEDTILEMSLFILIFLPVVMGIITIIGKERQSQS